MDKIGPFKIEDGPFEGGFGIVYKVFDTGSGDEFAIKTLKTFVTHSAPQLQLFRREIAYWTRIPTHPNVVRAIRAFEDEGRPYVLIEWVSGGTLQERTQELKPSDPAIAKLKGAAGALEVLRQLCNGMAHVHACGLIHGDLKPGNILMWQGRSPQITDFGFARAAGAETHSMGGGTRRYMAPELETSEPTTASDIYAAGVIFRDVLAIFSDEDFGCVAARELADEMCDRVASRRPTSFAEVRERLAAVLAKSEFPLGIPLRTGDRRTWDEKNADVIPERARFEAAISNLTIGRREDAKKKFQEIIARKPEMTDARIELAVLLAEEKGAQQAVTHLKAAEATQPDFGRLLNIASVYGLLEDWVEAERILTKVEHDRPDEPRIWSTRVGLAETRGDLTAAINHCRRYLECGGGEHARYSLGRLLRDAGLIDEAIAELSRLDDSDSGTAISGRQLLARIYVDTERYNDAIYELRQLLKLDLGAETQAYYYAEIGYCYKAQGLFNAAVASYEKCLALKPNDPVAMDGLCLAQEGRDKEAAIKKETYQRV